MNKEKTIRLGVLLLLVVIIVFCANYFSVNRSFYQRMLEQRKKESYSGVVSEKYIDKSEHSTPMLKFTNNKVISLENSFWDLVEVGDSIVKIKNQVQIKVYRNNNVIQVFDYTDYFERLIKNSKR